MTASYTDFDCERFIKEEPKKSSRSEFSRDRARIIHSSAFRRLNGKTQVHTKVDDFVRNRLTHSLEVAQIGRALANNLGLDLELVEAACLAHDLGHPPFGHNGEIILNEIAQGIGGFEGNAQTFRILTRLEPKYFADPTTSVGLNLARATLDATIKYPWGIDQAKENPTDSQNIKFNYYQDDEPIYQFVKKDAPFEKKPIEAQIMDIADDISYCVHDFEDGFERGLINFEVLNHNVDQLLLDSYSIYRHDFSHEEFSEAYNRLQNLNFFSEYFDSSFKSLANLKHITSSLIGRFVHPISDDTLEVYQGDVQPRYGSDLYIPREIKAEIVLIKSIVFELVMNNEEIQETRKEQQTIIKKLVNYYMSKTPHPAEQMQPLFLFFWNQCENDDERLRVAIDQVASLTDSSAARLSFLNP